MKTPIADSLQGKKTAIAAALVGLYGLAKAFAPSRCPDLPAGWEEGVLAVLMLVLRAFTSGPQTVVKKKRAKG